MKKIWFLSISFLLSGMMLTGCGSDDELTKTPEQQQPGGTTDGNEDKGQNGNQNGDDNNNNPGEDPNTGGVETFGINLTGEQKSAVANNNDFAFNFFRAVSQTDELKGKSTIMSPLSVTYALGMVNAGATGQTASEITTMLGFTGSSVQSVNALCQELIEQAPKVDESVELSIANCMAIDQSLQLKKQFQQDITDCYDAEVAWLDFKSADAVKHINDWCNQHTKGMIPSIVNELRGVLASLNAVYFKGSWSGKFDPAKTANETFTQENGNSQMLPVMNRLDATYYTQADIYDAIGLPYGNGKNWNMYVLLPHEGKTIADVLAQLNTASWTKTLKRLRDATLVDVKLPRFKADSDMELNEVLKQLGAPSMFLARKEFGNISENYDDLFVSLVKQKAAIEVSEAGTEASAVTIVAMEVADDGDDTGGTPTPKFYATRPFIYLIQEATSGAIFFIGTYQGE